MAHRPLHTPRPRAAREGDGARSARGFSFLKKPAHLWRQRPPDAGFTLFELLLYVGIFAVSAGLLTGVLITLTRVQVRESASVEVSTQAQFVIQRVQQLIRDASVVELSANTTTSTLKLRTKDPATDPTCVTLSNGAVYLMQGNDGVNKQSCLATSSAQAVTLTDAKVIVNTLTFKRFSNPPAKDTTQVNLTVTYNSANPQESAISRTLETAITKVSAAVFDSDIVPSADNSFDAGIGAQRWRNGLFSNSLLVGYTSVTGGVAAFNGNVGISTSTPSYPLDVYGGFRVGNASSTNTLVVNNGTNNVGIGTASPSATLSVNGTIYTTSGITFSDASSQTTAARQHGQVRLTKSGSNLLLSPYNGNKLIINGVVQTVPSGGVTLAPIGLLANTPYYIYAYMNGTTMTLEASVTTHAANATTGVEVKSTDATRTLVGMARTTAGAAWADSATQMFVLSWFNRQGKVGTSAFTTTRTTVSTTYVEINTEIRVEFLTWSGTAVTMTLGGDCYTGVITTSVHTLASFDGGTTDDGWVPCASDGAVGSIAVALSRSDLSEGYHYSTLLGKVLGSATATYDGGASPGGARASLHVIISG